MIRSALAALLLLNGCASVDSGSTESGWLTSLPDAQRQAKGSSKVILADFTGSDWCSWCKSLRTEVFSTKEFADWAGQKVVLLELDFPRSKSQTRELRDQNAALQEKFAIEGFPTVVFMDADGKELGRVGYIAGGPTAWIKQAESAMQGVPARREGG